MNLTTPHRWTIAALLVAVSAITAGSLRADPPSVGPDPVVVPQLDLVTEVSPSPVTTPATMPVPVGLAQIGEQRTVDSVPADTVDSTVDSTAVDATDDEPSAGSDDLGVDDDAGDDEAGDD
jgi:hypothetical protein